jgi:hypothetical protein
VAGHVDARDPARFAKGALAGAIGGLAGAWVMTRVADAWVALASRRDEDERNEDRTATERLVQRLADGTVGRQLGDDELAIATPAVHYALGAAMGAAYGAAVEAGPVNALEGAVWGAGVWVGTGTLGARILGIADLREMPGMSAQGFAVHVAFGVTNELVRRAVRGIM